MFSLYSPLCILQNATVLHTACKKKKFTYIMYMYTYKGKAINLVLKKQNKTKHKQTH